MKSGHCLVGDTVGVAQDGKGSKATAVLVQSVCRKESGARLKDMRALWRVTVRRAESTSTVWLETCPSPVNPGVRGGKELQEARRRNGVRYLPPTEWQVRWALYRTRVVTTLLAYSPWGDL